MPGAERLLFYMRLLQPGPERARIEAALRCLDTRRPLPISQADDLLRLVSRVFYGARRGDRVKAAAELERRTA